MNEFMADDFAELVGVGHVGLETTRGLPSWVNWLVRIAARGPLVVPSAHVLVVLSGNRGVVPDSEAPGLCRNRVSGRRARRGFDLPEPSGGVSSGA